MQAKRETGALWGGIRLKEVRSDIVDPAVVHPVPRRLLHNMEGSVTAGVRRRPLSACLHRRAAGLCPPHACMHCGAQALSSALHV